MGLRRLLRRAAKPAAMALVAGTLALSLTVTTTQKAEASPLAVLPVVLAAEAAAGVGIPLALPSVLATSLALHPVGWAIAAVAAVGIGLYVTKDYWLPYVTGAFGQSQDNVPGTGASILQDLSISNVTYNGYRVVPHLTLAGSYPSGKQVTVIGKIECRRPVGTTYILTGLSSSPKLGHAAPWSPTGDATLFCTNSTDVPIGYVVGAPNAALPELSGSSPYPGPVNVMRGGTFSTGTAEFDPRGADVKYKTTVECIKDDGTIVMLTAESLGDEGGVKVPSCAAAGLGHGTGAMKVEGYAPTAPGIPGTVPTTIWEASAPPVSPDYPLCGPERPGSGCKMAITIDNKPCVVGQWECENWSELYNDPTTAPRVGCTFGPYALSVEQCALMEPAYRPGGAPATEENTDGNPSTRSNTEPGGQTYTPPATGTGTIPGGAASGVPAGSTPEQAECFPSGWALANPVEWVMKPVGCALDAAFKPKKDLQTRLNAMSTQFSDKVPISWFGLGTEGVTGGACPTSWALDISGQHVSLICGTPVEGIIQTFRPFLGAMLVIAAVWPLIRSLFYAAIPVFKVNPS